MSTAPVMRGPLLVATGLSFASVLLAAAGHAGAATLSVGPGKTYVAPCAAFAAARDGDTIICVGTMEGTHEGDLMGLAPTHRKVQWRQCHLIRVDDDGKATEHRAIRDDAGLMRQLGIGPG